LMHVPFVLQGQQFLPGENEVHCDAFIEQLDFFKNLSQISSFL
jgi:hypothetical protein